MYNRPGPSDYRKEIAEAFGVEDAKLTAKQLWVLTKLCKYVRLRARNNAAFNNFMNSVFPHARFSQVTKTRKDGSTYPGLSITVTNQEGATEVAGAEEEEE